MKIRLGTKSLVRAAGAAALLGVALTVWGVGSVSITLTDGTNTINCTSTGDAHDVSGNISATVDPGCLGFSTLTVTKSGTGASTGLVTSTTPAGGINCGADCSEPYNNGTSVTLHAAPTAAGTTFVGWGGACSGTADCVVVVAGAATVTANFTAPPTLTVAKAGTGSGTVTGTGINCGTDCSELYGSPITLTATPDAGSSFAGWSGGGCAGAGTCTPSLTVSGTVTATFTGSCSTPPPTGALVTVIDTGNLGVNWPQQTFLPLPTTITAFKVTVPAGYTGRGSFTATKTSSASRTKMIVVSRVPGCADKVDNQSFCLSSQLESSKVILTTVPTDTYKCKLTPGTYYVNAFSRATVGGAYSCTTAANCSFYASRSGPL